MKTTLIAAAVALLRLTGCRVTYQVSRRSGAQGRGFGRTLFATGSLFKARAKMRSVRCGHGDQVYIRLETAIAMRESAEG